jgi:signal peptidase II
VIARPGEEKGGTVLNKRVIFFLTVAAVVVLDQATKAYIAATMVLHESLTIVQGVVNITHIRNPGAAFGFLAQASPGFRSFFFIAVTLLAIALIVYYIMTSRTEERWLVFGLSLILGGAAGNLVDRIRFGEVIDFIDVYLRTAHWPAFNVADSAISLGALIMLFDMMKRKKGSPAG